jgi:hypothetical protein
VVCQNSDGAFLPEEALREDDGPPSLRDVGLPPKRVALKNSHWIWENKNGTLRGHFSRAIGTLRPEPFFKGPELVFVRHDARPLFGLFSGVEADVCQSISLPDALSMVRRFSKRALERASQLVRRALRRQLQSRGRMLDNHGLTPFEPGFQHAVLIVLAVLAGVRVAEMDFNSGEMFVEMGQFVTDQTFGQVSEGFAALDAVVGADFDMYDGVLRKLPRDCRRRVVLCVTLR